ncbi:MAG: tape measure protein [Christensenella sp.]
MAYDGTLKFDTSLDASGMQKGANNLKSIVEGLGIFEILKKGVQMVADSVQAAMGRIDTMDQFSRVMTTMTGSTDKANAALKKTNSIVSGTAYGLDTAAKGVQAFAASGMEVSNATDTMGAWADAVSFYTKGTNVELETVSMALQKMGTKGNVTMEHLQMLLEAGIPAIQIYASAVGVSTEEVTAAMSRGELKTSDFIGVMNKAFQTGTTGFPSVAGAAKQAGASWAGSISNMNAATARGTASILIAFDKMFNVKGNMVAFGKGIENVMKGIADSMMFIVPTAIAATAAIVALKAAKSVAGGMDALKKSVKAVTEVIQILTTKTTGATLAYSTLTVAEKVLAGAQALGNVIMAAAKTVMLLLTGATWTEATATAGLSAAWKALNAVISASLFGWILLAIVAVTAAIAGICNAVYNANRAYYDEKDAIKELREEHEKYAEQLTDDKKAAEEDQQTKMAQIETSKQNIASLQELIAAQKNGADNTVAIQSAVQDLNEAMVDLGLAYDETTNKLNMTDAELQTYTDNLAAVSQYEYNKSEYNRLLGEQNMLQQQINAQLAKQEQYKDMYDAGTLSLYQYATLMNDSKNLAKEYQDSLNGVKVEVEATEGVMNKSCNSQAEIGKREQEIRNTQIKDVKKYSKQYGVSTDEIIRQSARMAGGVEEWAAKQSAKFTESGMDVQMLAKKWGVSVSEIESYCNTWGTSYNDFNEEMKATHTDAGLSIEQLAVKWGTTTDAIKEQMAMQGIDLQGWNDQTEAAWQKYQDSIAVHTEAVINGFKEIPAEYEMTGDEMIAVLQKNRERYAEWQANMRRVSQTVSAETVAELQKLGPGANSAIEDMIANGGEGLKEFDTLVQGSISDSVAYAKDNLTNPELTEAAYAMPTKMGEAVASNPAMNTAMGGIATDAKTAIDTQVENTDYTSAGTAIGGQVVQGVTSADMSGITTGISTAITAGTGGVQAAVNTVAVGVQTGFINMSTQAVQTAKTMILTIGTTIGAGRGAIVTATMGVVTAVDTTLRTLQAYARIAIGVAMTAIQSVLGQTDGVQTAARNIVSGITVKLSDLPEQAISVVRQMFAGMRNAMDEYAPSLYNKAQTIAKEIIRILKSAFDVHSPSRVTFGIFKNVMQGAVNAMDMGADKLYALTGNMAGGVLSQLSNIPEDVMVDMTARMHNAIASTKRDIARGMSVFVNAPNPNNTTTTNTTTNAPVIQFNEPVNSPDVVARRVSQVMRSGLAGGKR